jgi:hypothetical protein
MVRLVTAASPMEARILAARLGSEGIVWQFRGSVDGPLAMGPIEVMVDAEAYDTARGLLLADEVESAFGDVPSEERLLPRGTWRHAAWVVAVVLLLMLFALARTAARY